MKHSIVKILKKIRLYIPVKRVKDNILNILKNDRAEKIKMLNFYSQFIHKEDLCFDIGANMGNRTEIFLALGAKVIAVEPQTFCVKVLQNKYKNNKEVIILKAGVGEKEDVKQIKICNAPEFSTFSDMQLKQMRNLSETSNLEWHYSENVKMITLDNLIKVYGAPAFCKIDVEGYEKEVLAGLKSPLKLLSFEYNTLLIENALAGIDLLSNLGEYTFNYSVGESMELKLTKWVDKTIIKKILLSLPKSFSFGDIYARLR